MNEIYVTVAGNVVSDPEVRWTKAKEPFTTFRLASTVRRVDFRTGEYGDAGTTFVNVTAFKTLSMNVASSLTKGQPVLVYGRMRVNHWSKGDRSGTTVEIDAYNVGHDLSRGRSTFERVSRTTLDSTDRLSDPDVQDAQDALEPELDADPGFRTGMTEGAHRDADATARPPAAGYAGAEPGDSEPGEARYTGDPETDDYVLTGAGAR